MPCHLLNLVLSKAISSEYLVRTKLNSNGLPACLDKHYTTLVWILNNIAYADARVLEIFCRDIIPGVIFVKQHDLNALSLSLYIYIYIYIYIYMKENDSSGFKKNETNES